MPTKEQLQNRKDLVQEVRLLRGKKLVFGHEGYVQAPAAPGEPCVVCLLGSLITASMNRDNKYEEFIEAPWHAIQARFVPDSGEARGWTHQALVELCGLTRLQAYTLEAVYESTANTMQAHMLLDEDIEAVRKLVSRFEDETNLYDGTDDQTAEFILGVLEASADHPEGALVWFKGEGA